MRTAAGVGVVILLGFIVMHCANAADKKSPRCSDEIVAEASIKYVWKQHDDSQYAVSDKERCWDSKHEHLIARRCDPATRKWLPKKVDCSVWLQKNTFCPEDLIEFRDDSSGKYMCIKLSEQTQPYDDNFCYGSDVLAIEENWSQLQKFLRERKVSKFWVPITRARDGPFVVALPGKRWNEVYEKVSVTIDDYSTNDQCVAAIVDNSRDARLEIINCKESLYSLCIFVKHFVAVSGCPQDFGAISYRPNECYGVKWQVSDYPEDVPALSIAQYYQKRNIIQKILKQKEESPEDFFLVDQFENENGKYAVQMNAMEEFHIVPFDLREPALSYEIADRQKNVQMVLQMDVDRDKLVLIVYNRYYIWRLGSESNVGIRCFTNAQYDLWQSVKIKKFWENDLETKTMFELKLSDAGPGYYWCEAHTIFNFALVSTPKVVAAKRQDGHAFAALFDLQCDESICSNIFESTKSVSRIIKESLESMKEANKETFSEMKIHKVRVMRIHSVQSSRTSVTYLCHVTVSLAFSSVDNSSEQSSEEVDSEENELGIRHDTSVRIRLRNLLKVLVSSISPRHGDSVKSTEFCFPDAFTMANGESNQWLLARHGQAAATVKLCLQRNGLPVTRKCLGDFLNGAYWDSLQTSYRSCATDVPSSVVTQGLYDLDIAKTSKKQPEKAVKDIKQMLESSIDKLIPADFYYMAKIIQSSIKRITMPTASSYGFGIGQTPHQTNVARTDIQTTSDIVRIYNYIMKVNENIIKPSIVLNSTNMLLSAFENLIDKISLTTLADLGESSQIPPSITQSGWHPLEDVINDDDKLIETINYEDVGVLVKITSNLVIFVVDPSVANVTGIALFRITEDSEEEEQEMGMLRGAFENVFYRFILANQIVDDLLYEKGLELAAYMPTTLWERLDEISRHSNHTRSSANRPSARIVIKVYSNDKLFQEHDNDDNSTDRIVWGKIISISIPGHDRDLPEMLPLVMRANNSTKGNQTEHSCSYWNYDSWVNDGLTFLARSELDENIILCGCTHLTPFAYLIGNSYNFSVDSDNVVITRSHKEALDIISLLGCSLSLFGIMGIFVTAITFQSWRQKASTKVLLQLSAGIALQMILLCFVNTEEISYQLIANEIFSSCIAIGACLHYSVLVQFCWMIIIAYLQFKRYVVVFGNTRPKRFFIKSSLVGWGVPLIPVLIVLIFDRESYIPEANATNTSICYPTGLSLYLGVILPILAVILANFVIFVVVIYSILRGPDGAIRHTEKSLAISQLRLSVLLFFLLGLTWIFGLLSTMRVGLVFPYLFCLTATMQGFVLFLYFIVLDPVTRRMWGGYFHRTFGWKINYESSASMKETTQTFS